MPGRRWRSIKRPKIYEALRRQGMSKSKAAAVANSMAKHKKKKK